MPYITGYLMKYYPAITTQPCSCRNPSLACLFTGYSPYQLSMPRFALVYRVYNELPSVLQLCLVAAHTLCLCLAFLQGIQQQMKCSIRNRTNCKYSILSQRLLSDTHTLTLTLTTHTHTHSYILTLSLTLMQIMLKHSPGGHRAKNSIYTFCVLLLVLLQLQLQLLFLLFSKPKKTVANSSKLQTVAV